METSVLYTFLTSYLSIGLVTLLVLVFLIGLQGKEYSLRTVLIVLTWPLDILASLGVAINLYLEKKKEEKSQNPQNPKNLKNL